MPAALRVSPRAGSLLASLWPAVESVFADAMAAPIADTTPVPSHMEKRLAKKAIRLATSQSLPKMPANILSVADTPAPLPATAIDFEWAGETARHVGTVVHAFLHRIAEDGLANWDRERLVASVPLIAAELGRHGVAVDELSSAAERVIGALANTLADSRGRWTLQSHGQARAEWRLTGAQDGELLNIAIDRTFIDVDNVRWIIDFKTGGHEGSDVKGFLDNERKRYSEQLETYANILSALGEVRHRTTIRLGLYFPMLKGWREWEWKGGRKEP